MSKASQYLKLSRWGFLFSVLFLAVCGSAVPSFGQQTDEPLQIRVGYRVLPPFITKKDDGTLTGMASELWREIEKGFNIDPTYVEYATVADLLAATAAREVDVAARSRLPRSARNWSISPSPGSIPVCAS